MSPTGPNRQQPGRPSSPRRCSQLPPCPRGTSSRCPIAAALTDQAKEAIGRAIAASRSPNTRRNYQTAWRAWEDWARGCGYQALPAPGSSASRKRSGCLGSIASYTAVI